MSPPLRLFRAALASALIVGAIGEGWEFGRYGFSDAASLRRLETEVRNHIESRSSDVEALAGRVASERDLIVQAAASPDALLALFNRLAAAAERATAPLVTVTVYVPERLNQYRVLAWSDGPAGAIAADRLNGPAALFVAPGTAGLRLVSVQPVEHDGRRVAVAAAETVLSPGTPDKPSVLETRFGPVTIVPTYAVGALATASGFVVERPRLEVQYTAERIAGSRSAFRRHVLAAVAVPLIVALLLVPVSLLHRRRACRPLAEWLGWSTLAIASIAIAASAVVILARAIGAPSAVASAVTAGGLMAAVAIFPGGLWWRRWRRHTTRESPVRFVVEQLAAGAVLGAAILIGSRLLSERVGAGSLAAWRSALFPFDPVGLLDVWTVYIGGLAIWWVIAVALAVSAARWRLRLDRRIGAVAGIFWLLPLLGWLLFARELPNVPAVPAVVIAFSLCAFGLAATWLRRQYRRSIQSVRLLLGFVALVAPLASLFPLTTVAVERETRSRIEHDLGPQTAGQPDQIREVLLETQRDIDNLPNLGEQLRVSTPQPVESQTAFRAWNQTRLRRERVVSDIALYGPDGSLISRFALNFPDYLIRAAEQRWEGACGWDVTFQPPRGGYDRPMLHAERGFCDATGRTTGAVVLHVASSDQRALPFVASANPYVDILRGETGVPRAPAPPGLELVVYGWSLQPTFTTDPGVAWSIETATFDRIFKVGAPFWTDLDAQGRRYHVYFLQNRAGIYALGYPDARLLDHATRLAELAAVAALIFVIVQIAAAMAAPFIPRAEAPLRILLHEVRTSFYRKLFLFFVMVAVVPVLFFAFAFSAYMTGRARADVESEAASVVSVARRVFEQVAGEQEQVSQTPTDDVMVWIRQVVDQDVNLFEGSELVATSQRDLFNSGLLPTRTPASLYRAIALERLPSFVTEDQQYLVAASPTSARRREAILSVPLAPRQREIEEEVDELKRGVLVGSVIVILFAAWLGASLASRVSDPVARLTKATRQIAAGRLDVRIAADTADELKRLVDDFNSMTATLVAQRAELARTNQLKAWNEMARQVAHEIKNPLTPIQLATEHLQRVHQDAGHPLGDVFDQCVATVLGQVRLLRQIASEFANFAGEPVSRPEPLAIEDLVESVVGPYRLGVAGRVRLEVAVPASLPLVRADRTLLVRALTNLVENAIQAMPLGGVLTVNARQAGDQLVLRIEDTGIGMDERAVERAFEPYFSTKTGGSGLGLANARRNIEREGGTIQLASVAGSGTTITVTLPVWAAPPDGPGTGSGPSR